jgi:hypothetical protein
MRTGAISSTSVMPMWSDIVGASAQRLSPFDVDIVVMYRPRFWMLTSTFWCDVIDEGGGGQGGRVTIISRMYESVSNPSKIRMRIFIFHDFDICLCLEAIFWRRHTGISFVRVKLRTKIQRSKQTLKYHVKLEFLPSIDRL